MSTKTLDIFDYMMASIKLGRMEYVQAIFEKHHLTMTLDDLHTFKVNAYSAWIVDPGRGSRLHLYLTREYRKKLWQNTKESNRKPGELLF